MAEILDKYNERQILDLCVFAGHAANFDDSYDEIDEGSEIVLWIEKSEYNDTEAYRLRLLAVKAGEQALEGVSGIPVNKMFEAEVVRTTSDRPYLEHLEGEDRFIYGVLFPSGFASMVDNARS